MAAESATLVNRPAARLLPAQLRRHDDAVVAHDEAATVHELSAADTARRVFWAITGLHVAVWTAAPALTSPNRPLDMVEMLYWGHHWQWGYHKHPPLPAWIAEVVSHLFGGANWPLYLLGPLAVAISFWAAWQVAKEFLDPWPALCASALLECCGYYNFTAADLNHTIIVQPLWALAVLALYRSLTTGKLRYWCATGVCLGLAMLTKYDVALLVISMLLLPAINRTARAALKTPGPYLTLGISLALFLPHVVWMAQNGFSTVVYAVGRGETARPWPNIVNPLEFILTQFVALLPMLAVSFPLWRKMKPWTRLEASAKPSLSQDDAPHAEFQRDFLLLIGCGPFALDLSLSAATGVQLQSMWGAPMWTFVGLCLIFFGRPALEARVYRAVIARCVIVGLIVALVLVGKNVALPYVRHKASRVHFPGNQLADVVKGQWQQHGDGPLTVVAGPWWPAANVGLAVGGPVQIYDFVYPEVCPWSGDEALRKHGGAVVWMFDDDGIQCAKQVRFRFPDAEILPPFSLPCQTGADVAPVEFGMAIVRPSSVAADHEPTLTRAD